MPPRPSPELQKSLQRLRRGLVHKLPALLKNGLLSDVEDSAARLSMDQASVAPVSQDKVPGQLRDSHRYVLAEGGLRALVMAGGAEAPHAVHVEQGTKDMEAHSWFWPMYRLHRAGIRKRFRKRVTDIVKFFGANGSGPR